MDGVRKILFVQERVLAEAGSPAAMPVTRVAGIAVLKNPFAGTGYVADLSPLPLFAPRNRERGRASRLSA